MNTNQPMTPTPTPRTDAQTFDPYPWNQNGPGRSHRPEVMYPCDDGEWISADFARQLERENQTFRAAQKACEDCDAPRVDRIAELERDLAAEREQVAVWKHEARRLKAELETFDEGSIVWWCEYQDLKAKARQQ